MSFVPDPNKAQVIGVTIYIKEADRGPKKPQRIFESHFDPTNRSALFFRSPSELELATEKTILGKFYVGSEFNPPEDPRNQPKSYIDAVWDSPINGACWKLSHYTEDDINGLITETKNGYTHPENEEPFGTTPLGDKGIECDTIPR